jgi:hypothetical protein
MSRETQDKHQATGYRDIPPEKQRREKKVKKNKQAKNKTSQTTSQPNPCGKVVSVEGRNSKGDGDREAGMAGPQLSK